RIAARRAQSRRLSALRVRSGAARRSARARARHGLPARGAAAGRSAVGSPRIRSDPKCHDPPRRIRARAAGHPVLFPACLAGLSFGAERTPLRKRAAQRALASRRRSARVRLMAADLKTEVESALRAALQKVAPEHAGAPILVERPKQA